ncbi:MAG: DUF1926 domain-containing protein [Myxococcales bacterium]|nr:DUF1926 domain-containing protein [Myxococcales bacterium]
MGARVRIIFAIHIHQPVGNMGHVFEEACERAYEPYFKALQRHPAQRTALHMSGPLVDWLEKYRPKLLDTVVRLVGSGQVEMLGGGIGEPLLAQIPDCDVHRQLERTREYWKRRAGVDVRGIWLTERVWEPNLAKLIAREDYDYTIVDDEHFKLAGATSSLGAGKPFTGYYITERLGDTLALFPTDMALRYAIPFDPVPKLMEKLEALRAFDRPVALTYGDDGEKFGMWPGTYDWVVGGGWLDAFFDAVEAADWLELVPPIEQFRETEPEGRVYIPTASYAEMLEWSLPLEAGRTLREVKAVVAAAPDGERRRVFVHGGIWDGFLAKYPESNLIHKRMLALSREVEEARAQGHDVDAAEEALHWGQCNCAYWHGLFGGLYLPFLRDGLTTELIRGDCALEAAAGRPRAKVGVRVLDYDADGRDEILFTHPALNVLVDPGDGGAVTMLEHRPTRHSLLNVLSRKEESYHSAATKPAPNETRDHDGGTSIHDMRYVLTDAWRRELAFDVARRGALQDLVLPRGVTIEDLALLRVRPLWDGRRTPYDFSRGGAAEGEGEGTLTVKSSPIELRKTLRLAPAAAEMSAHYSVRAGPPAIGAWFVVESTWFYTDARGSTVHVTGGDGSTLEQSLETRRAFPGARSFAVADPYHRSRLAHAAEGAEALWVYPVFTYARAEHGFERILQGVATAWIFPLVGAMNDGSIEFEIVTRVEGP